MIETIASVRSNQEIIEGYKLLEVQLNREIEHSPGQFAMVRPSGLLEPLLRRALAIYRGDGTRVEFLYHVLGAGTQALSKLKSDDEVDILIPLGNSWPLATSAGQRIRKAAVVAGGIGSASVLTLCRQLKETGVETTVLFGAADERAAVGCGLDHFRELGLPMIVTTDDGSLGEKGLVTSALEKALSNDVETVYSCGPWPMMRRVSEISMANGITCYASLEAPMGCGFGVCVGCVVAVHVEAQGYGSYKRVCTDGSIFAAETIRWDVNAMGD